MSSERSGFGLLDGVVAARVGSASEPKIDAVRAALREYLPDVQVEGVGVASGVSEQPVGFEEITRGARNRAHRALGLAGKTRPDLGIGIEDGLIPIPIDAEGKDAAHLNIGCAAVTDGTRTAIGFSSAFAYPSACWVPAVRDREPIGEIFDRLWESRGVERPTMPSAKTIGNIGHLSAGALPRAEYARHGVLCALVAFLHPDLYENSQGAA